MNNLNVTEICKAHGFTLAHLDDPGEEEGDTCYMGQVEVLVPGDCFSSEDMAKCFIQAFEANRVKEFSHPPGSYFIAKKLLVERVDINPDWSTTYITCMYGNKNLESPVLIKAEAVD